MSIRKFLTGKNLAHVVEADRVVESIVDASLDVLNADTYRIEVEQALAKVYEQGYMIVPQEE